MSTISLIIQSLTNVIRLRDGHITGTLRNYVERMAAIITTTSKESVQIEKYTRPSYMCINANKSLSIYV